MLKVQVNVSVDPPSPGAEPGGSTMVAYGDLAIRRLLTSLVSQRPVIRLERRDGYALVR
jgi:hypothetical protein